MRIGRAVRELSVIGIGPDGWTVCGEPTRDAMLILGALFGCGVMRWPRTSGFRA